MANIILPEVEILSSLDQEATLLIEQNGEINRHFINDFTETIVSNIEIENGGGDVTIDLENSDNGEGTGLNADTLGGYPIEYFLNKLNQQTETMVCTGVFLKDNWVGTDTYTQTIEMEDILETDTPFIDVYLEGIEEAAIVSSAWTLIGRVKTENDKITAYCYLEKPNVDIPVILKVVR